MSQKQVKRYARIIRRNRDKIIKEFVNEVLVVLKGVVKRPDPEDYYKETDFETYRVLTFEEGYYVVRDYEESKTAVRRSCKRRMEGESYG